MPTVLRFMSCALVFQHACKLGAEGIVSKRLGSRYRSGRSPDWLKFKNPAAPAVAAFTRLAEVQNPAAPAVKCEAEEKMGAVKNRTHFNSPRGYVGGWARVQYDDGQNHRGLDLLRFGMRFSALAPLRTACASDPSALTALTYATTSSSPRTA